MIYKKLKIQQWTGCIGKQIVIIGYLQFLENGGFQ